MLSLVGTTIKITRGDTGVFNLVIKNPSTGEVYTPQAGDIVTFTVKNDKKNCPDCTPLVQKNFTNGQITLKPSDTKFLKYNTYLYDIQITFETGAVNTITNGTLTLTNEAG